MIVWRLLRKNVSVGQLLGYAVANLLGLAIVLTALQFYNDATSVESGDDMFISRDYIVVSKKVHGLGSLFGGKAEFSEEEVLDIESQPWVNMTGRFTSSAFSVYASVSFGGRGMSTALFFESIPDEFFDVCPDDWSFEPGQTEIPIIISKDYLALYNFGFASSQGLPQISEDMIKMIPLRVTLKGNGAEASFSARIVGFSSRLNTIAVPQDFMSWANSRFSRHERQQPSRLIIEVDQSGDPAIEKYFEKHGYESAGDKLDNGKISYILTAATSVVGAVGVVICLMSLFILLLSVYLLLQKNRDKLRDLVLLGYTPWRVARYYYVLVAVVNVVVLVVALVLVAVARAYWYVPLETVGTVTASFAPSVLVGVISVVAITLCNIVAINRNLIKSL